MKFFVRIALVCQYHVQCSAILYAYASTISSTSTAPISKATTPSGFGGGALPKRKRSSGGRRMMPTPPPLQTQTQNKQGGKHTAQQWSILNAFDEYFKTQWFRDGFINTKTMRKGFININIMNKGVYVSMAYAQSVCVCYIQVCDVCHHRLRWPAQVKWLWKSTSAFQQLNVIASVAKESVNLPVFDAKHGVCYVICDRVSELTQKGEKERDWRRLSGRKQEWKCKSEWQWESESERTRTS